MHTPVPPNPAVEPLAASFLNSFSCEELLHYDKGCETEFQTAKLRSVSSVSVRSGFSVRSARGDRNEVDACRPSPAPWRSRTIRAVVCAHVKARLQQKAVARPSAARVVGQLSGWVWCCFFPKVVLFLPKRILVHSCASLCIFVHFIVFIKQ